MRSAFSGASMSLVGKAVLTLGPLCLSGCMIMTPSPALEAANLAGVAVMNTASIFPGSATDAVAHPHQHIKTVCIEFNPAVAVSDFVSAIQANLSANGVDSRLYDTGMQPSSCEATLDYTASLDWDQRLFSDEYSPYLTYASLTLRQNGHVVASSNYKLGTLDKWASTRTKLSGAVKALLASK